MCPSPGGPTLRWPHQRFKIITASGPTAIRGSDSHFYKAKSHPHSTPPFLTHQSKSNPIKSSIMSSMMEKAKEFMVDKVAHIKKPEATVSDVDFKSITRDSVLLHAEVSVTNPYSHRLPVCELTYTLKCDSRVIASGTMADPGWIEASGLTKLDLPVKLMHSFLISLMRDLGRDWDLDYTLDIGLTIDLPIIGNFTIPISQSGELKLPTFSDLF